MTDENSPPRGGAAENPTTEGVNASATAKPGARKLPPEAERALAEAAERRRLAEAREKEAPPAELHGAAGPEPVRYGDWERKGRAIDF